MLKGLCSFGTSYRLVLDGAGEGKHSSVRIIRGRFSSPVIPGNTLHIHVWKENPWILFEVTVKETGKKVISDGAILTNNSTSKL